MLRAGNDLDALFGGARRVVQRLRVGREVVRCVLILLGRDVERGHAQARSSGQRVELARDGGRSGDGNALPGRPFPASARR